MANMLPEQILITDAIRIDVQSSVDTTFNFVPNGDVIAVTAFFDSSHKELDIIRVKGIKNITDELWPRLANELEDVYRSRLQAIPLFKTIGAMWAGGARNIIIVKAGNESDIPTSTFIARNEYIFDKTKRALDFITEYDFVDMVYSVESQYQLIVDTTITTATLEKIADSRIVRLNDTAAAYSKMSYGNVTLYKNAVEVSSDNYVAYSLLNFIEINEATYDPDAIYTLDYVRTYDWLDFMGTVCAESMKKGNIIQTVLSTSTNSVTNTLNNETLYRKTAWQNYFCKAYGDWIPDSDKFRFVSVVHGYGGISVDNIGYIVNDGFGPLTMGLMSILNDDIAVTGRILSNVRLEEEPTQREADLLSENGFMPFGGTVRSRRGLANEVRALSDSNMGVLRSEFRQTAVLRLTRRLAKKLKTQLRSHIGSRGDGIPDSIAAVMNWYSRQKIIRRYNYKLSRPANDPHKVLIMIQFLPYFSTRVIEVSIVAGSVNIK